MKTGFYSMAIGLVMIGYAANFQSSQNRQPDPDPKDVLVIVDATGFHPQTVTIAPGQTVSWYNAEQDGAHSATADDFSWDTGDMWPFATCWITFDQPGVYNYHCMHHPEETGVVIVSK